MRIWITRGIVALCLSGFASFGVMYWLNSGVEKHGQDMTKQEIANAAYLEQHSDLQARAELAIDRVLSIPRPKALLVPDGKVGATQEKGTIDQEWSILPRLGFDLPAYLLGPPGAINSRRMFRHKRLNPTDEFIPKKNRDAFALIVEDYKKRLSAAAEAESQSAAEEFTELVEDGRAQSRSIKQVESELTDAERKKIDWFRDRFKRARAEARQKAGLPSERSSDPDEEVHDSTVVPALHLKGMKAYAFKSEKGKLYRASLEELPATKRIAELRSFYSMELSAATVQWFGLFANLPKTEQDKLMGRVSARIDSFLTREKEK